MGTRLIKAICEYDLGQNLVLFSTKEKAREFMADRAIAQRLDPVFMEEYGLLCFGHVELDPS